jgi:peptide/nickel transport system substrate-binding protein
VTVKVLWLSVALIVGMCFGAAAVAQTFGESPMLAQRVASGELPPVEERLPTEPYVVVPIDEIGQYGGVARSVSQYAENWGDDMMLTSFINGFVQPNPAGELAPHFARQIDVSDDFTNFTFHLYEGVKWSDGHPYTTEDVMFWYENVLLNEELTPSIHPMWRYGDAVAVVEALDEVSFSVTFAGPSPFFLYRLVHTGNIFHPKHYLSQFHPNFTSAEELDRLVREAGFEHWYQLYANKNLMKYEYPMTLNRPTLSPYVLVEKTSEFRRYERNPYYWKVDSAGNQLPYIDGIFTEIVPNREILNGKIIAGEIDFAGFDTELQNYPLYRRYEEAGNYRVLLWRTGLGSDVIYQLNLTHEDTVLREIFQDVRFRRALSLAINRDEINEEIYFGQAEPTQYTLLPISRYYKPEYAAAFIEYDVEAARGLLDDMGLAVDPNGLRLRPDGEVLSFTIEYVDWVTPKRPNVELVTEYWGELGLTVTARPVSGELQGQRAPANLMDATLWHGDKATDMMFPGNAQFFVPMSLSWEVGWAPEWIRWLTTSGGGGTEPPQELKDLYAWWQEMLFAPSQERIDELGDMILASQAENLWVIGTIGNSPHPVIANKDLGNVPETGYWVWDMLWTSPFDPEQMFFRR